MFVGPIWRPCQVRVWDNVWDTAIQRSTLGRVRGPKVTLRVKDRGGGPVIYARFRFNGLSAEPVLGRGWVVARGSELAKHRGKELGEWVERKGRAPDGFLTPDEAWQQVPSVIERYLARAEAEKRARQDGARVTLEIGMERWLVARRGEDPTGEREPWKHAHAKNMGTYARRIVRELGPHRFVDSFSEAELRHWLAEDLKPMRNGEVLRQPTSRKMRATYSQALSGFFEYAHELGWTAQDPSAELPAYRARRKRADDPLRREEYLTKSELRAVIAELRRFDEDADDVGAHEANAAKDATIVMTMAMAGLRPGEADALPWDEIDFGASAIRVVDARTMGVTDKPKSGSGRTVPMSSELATALRGLRNPDTADLPGARVFAGPEGGHVDMVALRSRFKEAQAVVGIEPARTLRQLRNTFGTVCASEGVPLRTIQQWMGHASITTTEIYASFMPRERDAAIIEAAFG